MLLRKGMLAVEFIHVKNPSQCHEGQKLQPTKTKPNPLIMQLNCTPNEAVEG
jgi:hypothetical protein